jgi:hypothetical protein
VSLSVEAFVDGYPVDPSQPDYAIHRIIDGELRNCQGLEGSRALPGKLYPAYFASAREERAGWLRPALLRYEWNAGREPWAHYLSGLIRILLPSRGEFQTSLSPDTVLLLAQLGPLLQRNVSSADCYNLNKTVAANIRSRDQHLSAELIEASRKLVIHLVDVHCHDHGTFDIAWNLWRNPHVPHDEIDCLSTIVGRDLAEAGKAESAAWNAFWNLRGENKDPHNFIGAPYLKKTRAAVKAIGPDNFSFRFQDWIGRTAVAQPVRMTAACREVLILLLHGCRAEPPLPIDDALLTLSGLRWAGSGNALLQKEWLGDLLEVIAARPAARAFACAERLSINPDTSRFRAVSFAYHRLIEEITDDASVPEARKGVDEYDLNREPALYHHQLVLDRHLRARLPRERTKTPSEEPAEPLWREVELPRMLAMRQVSADPKRYLRAIALRKNWLVNTRKEPGILTKTEGTFGYEVREVDRYHLWICALAELEEHLLAARPLLDPEELTRVIESISLSPAPGSAPLYEMVSAQVRSHGYSLELVGALERWRASLKRASNLYLRRRISRLLWFENVSPVQDNECWSSRIRKDLRSLTPDSRAAWEKLLQTARSGVSKPSAKWQREAAAALTVVGPASFREKLREWFEPFRAAEPVKLTAAGRDILRNLLFYALVARDPGVDEAVFWFASAKWRTKKDQACARMLIPSFIFAVTQRPDEFASQTIETYLRQSAAPLTKKSYRMYEELCERLGRTPLVAPPPAPAPPDIAALKHQLMVNYLSGPSMKVEGDRLVVTGVRDSYSINIGDGHMVRRSDGCAIEVNLDAFDSVLAPFKDMLIGAPLMGAGSQNYFRVKICAKILAHDDENFKHIRPVSKVE